MCGLLYSIQFNSLLKITNNNTLVFSITNHMIVYKTTFKSYMQYIIIQLYTYFKFSWSKNSYVYYIDENLASNEYKHSMLRDYMYWQNCKYTGKKPPKVITNNKVHSHTTTPVLV